MHGVREHVLADDEIERPFERDREVVEIDRTPRWNAVHLLNQVLLVLEQRHDRAIGVVEALDRRGQPAKPRSDLEDARAVEGNQRPDDLHMNGVGQPIDQERRQVFLARHTGVVGHEDAREREAFQLVARLIRQRVRAERQLAWPLFARRGASNRFLEPLEQPGVAHSGRSPGGVDDAAVVAQRKVVAHAAPRRECARA